MEIVFFVYLQSPMSMFVRLVMLYLPSNLLSLWVEPPVRTHKKLTPVLGGIKVREGWVS